jgi:hypothetical protein
MTFGYWLLDSYTYKSENFLLTFFQFIPKISPPLGFESQRLVGGDEGEGGPEGLYFAHPHPCLPAGRLALPLRGRVNSFLPLSARGGPAPGGQGGG